MSLTNEDTDIDVEQLKVAQLQSQSQLQSYSSIELDTLKSKTTPPPPPNDCKLPNSSQLQSPSHPQLKFTPSTRLLFYFISRKHTLLLLVPAVIASAIAGGVAPFMTFVVGQAFDAFAAFSSSSTTTTTSSSSSSPSFSFSFSDSSSPSAAAQNALIKQVGIAALELVGLAVGAMALGSVTSCLWIWTGEMNVMALRKAVYAAVAEKEMGWFDKTLGANESAAEGQSSSVGAGGLMAKFSRETDDVRMASSLASGMLIQYLTTSLTSLILAFLRSWSLTLIILSALPLLVLVQTLSQTLTAPLLAAERADAGVVSTRIERAVVGIATVKAFNAAGAEHARAGGVFARMGRVGGRLSVVWAVGTGAAQFVMMGMFVQGFWFGAKLVRDGRVSAGDVMTVFWACLIASSNLQQCIPQFIVLAKGKSAMVSLLELAGPLPPSSQPGPTNANHPPKHTPSKCLGTLTLTNVSFSYPSRPSTPALLNVSLFLPAGEMTFIVGSSGSGKSTLAHLLLGMYQPQEGVVALDEVDLRELEGGWVRERVACVGQQGAAGVVVLDGKSVWENVVMAVAGREGERSGGEREGEGGETQRVTREQVEEACRVALMHEFVRDLPRGYDTLLGGSGGAGVGLSGGQKQRLAIARARLRDPTVLILDEATSALDPTSRILVFEAIKRWRSKANKTTVVITHDLSQIEMRDFVYVLRGGRVVEQGYRGDLEGVQVGGDDKGRGEFRKMMEAQLKTGGFLPEKEKLNININADADRKKSVQVLHQHPDEHESGKGTEDKRFTGFFNLNLDLKHQSFALRPLSFGAWMFDVVADLTTTSPAQPASDSNHASTVTVRDLQAQAQAQTRPRRPSTAYYPNGVGGSLDTVQAQERRFSLPPTPTSATFTHVALDEEEEEEEEEDEFNKEKSTMEKSAATARQARGSRAGAGARPRTKWDNSISRAELLSSNQLEADKATAIDMHDPSSITDDPPPPFWPLMASIYTSLPHKPLLFLGLLICIANGAMTPLFSFLLSRLLFEVSIGARDVRTINFFGGLVLATAAVDGVLLGVKYYIMESCAMQWLTRVREIALARILAQDKKWFDRAQHGPARLVQILVKDGDDARDLIAVVWAQCCVVSAMVGVGLVWAFVRSWQLTLAGLAIGPVFAGVMAVQSRLVARCVARNKEAREVVAKGYYDTIINIRAIRAMALDRAFKAEFDAAVDVSLTTGVRGAFVEGCTYGVANGLIYLAEALLFYVAALLVAKQIYSYLQMIEALNLIVFSVTIGSQLMAFTQKIARAVKASSDFDKLVKLSTETEESKGTLRPKLEGNIEFHNVDFTYPERPEAPVLKDLNLTISPGECIAIVGASGSGKSTLVSLLQRLYEPTAGSITLGGVDLNLIDTAHLRDNVAVVSQHPHLFDASIAENIRYGRPWISDSDVRCAAEAANVHEFIAGLPQGYDTTIGENAALLSGGQAQRVQIARALAARSARILIFDECTSSLDRENTAAVLDAIRGVMGAGEGAEGAEGVEGRRGRTMVMVTHNLDAMRMCDRVVVVQEGRVVEEGRYEVLVQRKGVFASLARGGEWVSL